MRLLPLLTLVGWLACTPEPLPPPASPVRPPPVVTDDAPPVGPLDDRALPRGHTLELELDPEREDYRGTLRIELDLARAARVIWLHARGPQIERAIVTERGGRPRPAALGPDPLPDRHTGGQADLIGLAVDGAPLGPGRVVLELGFRARYGKQVGLVRVGRPGQRFVFSDFEPTDARAAFPCLDDPRFKTPWTVSLVIPSALVGAGNYPLAGREALPGGRTRLRFRTTRPLPTYLVAVVAGRFAVVEGARAPVPLRVLTLPGTEGKVRHALQITPRILERLARYFDEPVPVPKLDLFAMPDVGLPTGGMENPGLITLQAKLLLRAADAQPYQLEETSFMVAHELSHLWLGDLITFHGWDDLWLSEGLATWMGHHLMPMLAPDWTPSPRRTYFAATALLQTERTRGRTPVRVAITTPRSIAAQFSIPTYAGGAAFLATLEPWLGPERLRRLLAGLVHRHRDGVVTTASFIAALQTAAAELGARGVDVAAMTRGFLERRRAPCAVITPACNEGGPSTVGVQLDASGERGFPVPVCVTWAGGKSPACAVTAADGTATIRLGDGCPSWVQPNPGGAALYRSRLAPGWTSRLLVNGAPDDAERGGLALLLRDAPISLGLEDELDLLGHLAARGDVQAFERLRSLERALVTPPRRASFAARMAARGGTVGFVRGNPDVRDPGTMAAWLAQIGVATARAEARQLVEDYLEAPPPGAPPATTVMVGAGAGGDARLFARLRARAQDPRRPRCWTCWHALGSFQDRGSLPRVRALIRDRRLGANEVHALLERAAENPALRDHLWDLIVAAGERLSPGSQAHFAGAICEERTWRRAAAVLGEAPEARRAVEACLGLRKRRDPEWPAWR